MRGDTAWGIGFGLRHEHLIKAREDTEMYWIEFMLLLGLAIVALVRALA
jgi:hypothetical protein